MDGRTVAAVGLGAALGAGLCYAYLRQGHGVIVKSTSTSQLSGLTCMEASMGTCSMQSMPPCQVFMRINSTAHIHMP